MSDENDRKFADAPERIEHASKQAVNLARQLPPVLARGDPVRRSAILWNTIRMQWFWCQAVIPKIR